MFERARALGYAVGLVELIDERTNRFTDVQLYKTRGSRTDSILKISSAREPERLLPVATHLCRR